MNNIKNKHINIKNKSKNKIKNERTIKHSE